MVNSHGQHCRLRRHLATFIGATVTRLGALLTMFHCVLAAFVTARFADGCAQIANGFGVLAVAGHCRHRQRANSGAVHIQGDASDHHFHILLMQARSGAVATGHDAGIARFNTGFEFLLGHEISPEW
jgi:hypothetical protein